MTLARRERYLAALTLFQSPGIELLQVALVLGPLLVTVSEVIKALVIVERIVINALEAQHAELVSALVLALLEGRLFVCASQSTAGNTRR